MEQRYLHFQVDSYKNDPHIEAVITGSGKPVSDSQGRLKARFHFLDTVWNSLIKTAFFIAEGEKAYSMLIEENECDIPAEVLQGDGFSLSVYGVEAGQSNYLWTDVCHVGLAQSGSTVAQLPSEPTVDIYTQILAAVEAAQNAAEQAESVSQTAAEQAEEALQAASGVLEAMEPITLPSPPTDATEGTVGQASVYVLRSIDKVFDHYNGLTPVYATKYLWENISGTAIFTDTADAPDDFTPAKAGQLVVTTRAVYICVYALATSQGSYHTKWQLICLLNLQLDAEPTSGLMGFPGQQATYDGNTYILIHSSFTDNHDATLCNVF